MNPNTGETITIAAVDRCGSLVALADTMDKRLEQETPLIKEYVSNDDHCFSYYEARTYLESPIRTERFVYVKDIEALDNWILLD